MHKSYPSKSQPVSPPDKFPAGVARTSKSPGDRIEDVQDPYRYRAKVGRDEDEAMRSRPGRSDYGKKAQVEDSQPEGAIPVMPRTIGI